MTEPDVALTDYALAVECAAFAIWIYVRGSPVKFRRWLVLFFAAAAIAPLAGGTVHGFFLDEASLGAQILWPLALAAVGVAALAGWAIAAKLVLSEAAARVAVGAACVQLGVYAALLLAGRESFWVAIAAYLPATIALLSAIVWRAHGGNFPGARVAALGLALTLAAAVLQQARVDLHPTWFTHNALYHAVQAIGFALFFAGSRRWVCVRPTGEDVPC